MNIRETFIESLHYPFSSPKNFLILFILIFGSSLIVPLTTIINPNPSQIPIFSLLIIGPLAVVLLNIIISGYLIRTIKSTLDDSNQLPAFKDWREMFWDGLRYLIVLFVYNIPLIPLLIIRLPYQTQLDPAGTLIYYLITALYTFLLAILTFMALGNMAHKRAIGGAFKFKMILKLIKNISWKEYGIYVFIYTLITIIFGLIKDLPAYSTASDFVSWMVILIIVGVVSTYSLAFEGRLIGSIYLESQEDEIED